MIYNIYYIWIQKKFLIWSCFSASSCIIPTTTYNPKKAWLKKPHVCRLYTPRIHGCRRATALYPRWLQRSVVHRWIFVVLMSGTSLCPWLHPWRGLRWNEKNKGNRRYIYIYKWEKDDTERRTYRRNYRCYWCWWGYNIYIGMTQKEIQM